MKTTNTNTERLAITNFPNIVPKILRTETRKAQDPYNAPDFVEIPAQTVCATVGFGEVESANIVGYTQKAIASDQYVLTGIQFESIDSLNKLTSLVGTSDTGTKAWDGDDNIPGWYNNAMTLMVPKTTGGYDYYYYASDGYDEANDSEYAGWCDKFGYIQPGVTLTTGLGVWFKGGTASDETITVSGQVISDDTTTTSVGAGYTIVANPYPIAVDLQTVATTAHAGTAWDGDDNVPGWYNNAPTIMVPKSTGGYDYYYYAADGYDEADDSEYAGWCDKFGYIQKDVTIPVSTGIWFSNAEAATLTFSK